MKSYEDIAELLARILIALLFLLGGWSKIGNFVGTQTFMQSAGVPGALLPMVILLELFGAIALIIGWQTRYTAFALAGFTLLAALLFHNNFSDHMQQILFLKNLSISGGLLLLAVHGAGEYALDTRQQKS